MRKMLPVTLICAGCASGRYVDIVGDCPGCGELVSVLCSKCGMCLECCECREDEE
jgi:hypothetical protein